MARPSGCNAARPGRRVRAWLLVFAAPLAGCTVGPNFERPAPPAVARYTAQPLGETAPRFDAAADVPARWWEAFGSDRIDRLVDRALAANPDLKSAEAALRGARETLAAQRGDLYPQVQAGLTASRQRNPEVLASPVSSNANYFGLNTGQVAVSYAPDVFGAGRRQIEAATAQVDNQRYLMEAAYLTLTSNVVLAALQAASLRAQIDAARDSIRLAEASLADLQRQHQLGQAASGDVAAQAAALAQARLALPPLEKQLAVQADLLAALTGGLPATTAPDDVRLADVRLPAELPLSLPSKLVDQRPDIRAAEANLHAASALVGVAKANRLPNITLSAIMGGSSGRLTDLLAPQNNFWDLTAGVTQPVFDGGALKHRQRAAEAAYDQAAAQYRSTVNIAFQNVADTLHSLDQDGRSLALSTEAYRASAQSARLARQQFDAGEVNAQTFRGAEQARLAAATAVAQAQGAQYADAVALFAALGGGWWNRNDGAGAR